MKKSLPISIVIFILLISGFGPSQDADTPFLSPTSICIDAEAREGFISLSTAAQIAIVDLKAGRMKDRIDLPFNPRDIIRVPDSQSIVVADQEPEGSVHVISTHNHQIVKSIRVGHTPQSLVMTPDKSRIFVCNRFSHTVSVIDTDTYQVITEIPVGREPVSAAASPQGSWIAVADYLPDMAATDTLVAAKVHLIDSKSLEPAASITLTNGSQSVRDLVFSADGCYLYASHVLSRNTLPTTQIEHGWINCNGISIIDVKKKELLTTILLDRYDQGAANPAGMSLTGQGRELAVALSGVHAVAFLDLTGLHDRLSRCSPQEISQIPYDFKFLQGLIRQVPTRGKSPRYVAGFEDQVLVSCYFSDRLEVFTDLAEHAQIKEIALGKDPKMTAERLGEWYFSDADLCFQKWQSCISCHPDGRADGLNWDLLNDGMGNPKNGKSMLYSHFTPPVMITGVREKAEVAVRSGIKYILFSEVDEEQALCIDAYLKSLHPVPSPWLEKGKLSRSARKGQRIYEQAGCQTCHSGPYYTDYLKYDVGTGTGTHENEKFDVPTLKEVWRTAPYLYDGRARTMKEVLTRFNPHDEHGRTSHLSEDELNDLAAYILSL